MSKIQFVEGTLPPLQRVGVCMSWINSNEFSGLASVEHDLYAYSDNEQEGMLSTGIKRTVNFFIIFIANSSCQSRY